MLGWAGAAERERVSVSELKKSLGLSTEQVSANKFVCFNVFIDFRGRGKERER